MTHTVHDSVRSVVGQRGARMTAATTSITSIHNVATHCSDRVTYTLYLIRHGEAAHNILEKAAEKKVNEDAIAAGHDPDSEQVRAQIEEARKKVLDDPALLDARLSAQGLIEAQQARKRLKDLLQSMPDVLQEPTEVLASPLQRALQTADIIFHPSSNVHIHVREELRERQTGKPPDTYSSSDELRRRNTFQRFSMSRLRQYSIDNLDFPYTGHEEEEEAKAHDSVLSSWEEKDDHANANTMTFQEEDNSMLRRRTRRLFQLLPEFQSRHVALVTHKGYLRELEHGPLCQRNTSEFQNCEIRVYKVTFAKGRCHDLDAVERIV